MIKVYENIVAIPPGETIKELLSIKRISQVELAKRMGYDKKTVNEIINGKGSLTRNTAILLSNILGLSVQSWLNLEAAYNSKLAMIGIEKKTEK